MKAMNTPKRAIHIPNRAINTLERAMSLGFRWIEKEHTHSHTDVHTHTHTYTHLYSGGLRRRNDTHRNDGAYTQGEP